MGYFSLSYITILFILTFSCGSSQEKTTESRNVDSGQQTTVNKDTIAQKDTILDMPPPPDPAPAPGTVRVMGMIINVVPAERDSSVIYHIKASKILGMGSTAPAVLVNDTLQVSASARVENIDEDSSVICTVRHQQVLVKFKNKNTVPSWQLMSMENKKVQ